MSPKQPKPYGFGVRTTARYVPGPGTDEPLVWYQGASLNNPNWPVADTQGSIIGSADASGNPGTTYTYDPYGNQSNWTGELYRYTGQLEIQQAHLYYYKARMYDPFNGRFLQIDPIGFDADVNDYANNDPINGSDPTGLTDATAQEFVVTGKRKPVEHVEPAYITIIIGNILRTTLRFVPNSTPNSDRSPQNKQSSPSSNRAAACAALVAKNDLAGSTLDAASIIPGGGDLADVARLGAGAASLGISVSQGNKIGTAIGATGTALGGVVVARNTVNAAAVGVKDGLEAVPGIGTVVGLGSLAFDAYSAVDDYNKCMSRH